MADAAKSAALAAASRKGVAARWGERRAPLGQMRVDAAAAAAFREAVPERDRRRVASDAILRAAEEYRNART